MLASLLSIFNRLKNEFGPQHWWPAKTPFEVVVGAILTQNTAWSNVEKAIKNLRGERLLSANRMHRAKPRLLASLIRPAGYFNVKSKRLKNFITFLNKEYSGSLDKLFKEPAPRLRGRLLGVNGIGPETADSIMLYAAGKPIFVVDAYTKRIFSRLGMLNGEPSYDTVQRYFEARLPKDRKLFNEFHALIVKLAKEVCTKKPNCRRCPLRLKCSYFLPGPQRRKVRLITGG